MSREDTAATRTLKVVAPYPAAVTDRFGRHHEEIFEENSGNKSCLFVPVLIAVISLAGFLVSVMLTTR